MKDTSAVEQQYRGLRTIADQSGPWWLSSLSASEPQPPENQPEAIEAESVPAETNGVVEPREYQPDNAKSDALNEFHWSNISERDRDYLTAPRSYPQPCPWCGGIYHHHRLCDALRASWELSLPFGKHKGIPLSQVPRDYLEWLVSCGDGINGELRDSIRLELGR